MLDFFSRQTFILVVLCFFRFPLLSILSKMNIVHFKWITFLSFSHCRYEGYVPYHIYSRIINWDDCGSIAHYTLNIKTHNVDVFIFCLTIISTNAPQLIQILKNTHDPPIYSPPDPRTKPGFTAPRGSINAGRLKIYHIDLHRLCLTTIYNSFKYKKPPTNFFWRLPAFQGAAFFLRF